LAPEPGSRRLYAGCRLGSNQVAPKPVPRPVASSVPTSLGASRRVISGSLSSVFTGSHLTPFTGAFSATLTTPAVVPAQLAVVWSLLLIDRRLRGAYPHHQRSTLSGPPSTSEPPPRFASQQLPADRLPRCHPRCSRRPHQLA